MRQGITESSLIFSVHPRLNDLSGKDGKKIKTILYQFFKYFEG